MLILNLFYKEFKEMKKLMLLIPKSINNTLIAVFFTKLYALMIDLANQSFFTEEK